MIDFLPVSQFLSSTNFPFVNELYWPSFCSLNILSYVHFHNFGHAILPVQHAFTQILAWLESLYILGLSSNVSLTKRSYLPSQSCNFYFLRVVLGTT